MAGEIKINDVSIATESGGTVTLGNTTLGSTVVLGTNASPIASNLVLAAGNGIDFSAASGSAAGSSSAVLDDYEEGTFTPTLQSGTHSLYHASYIKIGKQVTIQIVIGTISDTTSNTSFYIGGMPFTANTGKCVGTSMWSYGSAYGHHVVYMAGDSKLGFYQGASTSNYSLMKHSDLTSSSGEVHLYATYEAA